MKGYLKKTEKGWFVIYDQILGEGIVKRNQNALPLHPLDVKQIDEDSKVFDNIEARIKAYPDVEFEIETKLVFDRPSYSSIEVPKYAKLINKEDIKPKQCNTWDDIFDKIESEMDCVVPLKVVNYLEKYYKKPELLFSQTDEKGKPLTYWGGLEKHKQDLEEEIFNLEQALDIPSHLRFHNSKVDKVEKLAELESEVQGWGKYEGLSEQNGFKDAYINGYNKAKKTLYTEEEVRKAIRLTHSSQRRYLDFLEDDIIQSLKQK